MSCIRTFIPLRSVVLLLLAAGCAETEQAPEVEAPETAVTETATQEPVDWTYSGEGGPDRWGTLDPEFAACQTGTNQSPVNLANATRTDLPDLQFNYQPTPLDIENKGHTVQLDYQPGSSMTVEGTTYQLLQFHFHTPAEHRLQGKELPAELHLVHRGPGGELAVVGVLIERGDPNAAIAPVWNHLPKAPGQEQQNASVRINAEDLLPATRQHYRYAGSLTTPPCTEGVSWFVLDEPIELSAEQIDSLHSVIGTSNRPVQPLGNRELRLDT